MPMYYQVIYSQYAKVINCLRPVIVLSRSMKMYLVAH
jgi:hypothetical protein